MNLKKQYYMQEEVLKLYNNDLISQAKKFSLKEDEYKSDFLELLKTIYQNYILMTEDKIKIPKKENKIRDILVDDYLSKNIKNYNFKKEQQNNHGRVDIFIQETFTDEKPEFIIECKVLNSKYTNSKDGLNGKYVSNGILRFLTEHYYLDNNFHINAMIGFVFDKIDITQNTNSINELSKMILNNLCEITQKIELVDTNIYQSQYKTNNDKKFIIYHQMMDFKDNTQKGKI